VPFLVAFVVVPLVELYILIEVGGVIGALPTIGLCLLTAMLGAALLKQQGLRTLARARSNLNNGQLPAIELFEGVVLAVGGIVLLTPGLVTDAFGFACLVPFTRRWIVAAALRRMQVYYGPPSQGRGGHRGDPRVEVIDGTLRRHDSDDDPRR